MGDMKNKAARGEDLLGPEEQVPVASIKFNDRIRKAMDDPEEQARLRRLGEDMLKHGQHSPVMLDEHDTVIAGNRRAGAAVLVGMTHLRGRRPTRPLSEAEKILLDWHDNFNRLDLSGWNGATTCKRLLELNPTWTQKVVGESLGISETVATHFMAVWKDGQRWQDALRDGLVKVKHCYAASKLKTPEEKDAMLDRLLGKGRKGTGVSRVRVPVGGGASVAIEGKDFGMAKVVETLSTALKSAKRALAEGLDTSTWQKVLQDKNKNKAGVAGKKGGVS
jgi:hypothetical protein